MVKSIYKITNTKNGKVYIGQSKDCTRRFRDHQTGRMSNLHKAFIEYGADAFTMEILEKDVENYDEREIYWIAKYRATDPRYGYNVLKGGNELPHDYGEDSIFAKFSNETIEAVQEELAFGQKSFAQLQEEYGVSVEYLSFINRGVTRKNKKYEYPLRVNGNERLSEELVRSIATDLAYTALSLEKITKLRGVKPHVIRKINVGLHVFCPKDLEYPIRPDYGKFSAALLNAVCADLMANDLMFVDIAKKYGISRCLLSRINQGARYRIRGVEYPIRKSSERVYRTCRDYPGLDRE